MAAMNLLALETSCEHGSVALYVDGNVHEQVLEGHANHSEFVIATIRELLCRAERRIDDLDAVAFGSGPGAFTGLRLSCGIAQGLALGAGIGVVPVSSLAALAFASGNTDVFVATDARMNEVYHCAYRVRDGIVHAQSAVACLPPGDVELPPGVWFGVGSAFSAYGDVLLPRFAGRLSDFAPDAVPTAHAIAKLAAAELARGIPSLSPDRAAPSYVRDKVALTTAERLARGGRA